MTKLKCLRVKAQINKNLEKSRRKERIKDLMLGLLLLGILVATGCEWSADYESRLLNDLESID